VSKLSAIAIESGFNAYSVHHWNMAFNYASVGESLLEFDLDEILGLVVGFELKDGLSLSHCLLANLTLIRVQSPVDIEISEFISYEICNGNSASRADVVVLI
jgi:hypothetical protein